MGMLRILTMIFPVIYTYTFVNYFVYWIPTGAGTLMLSILFPVLLLISVMAFLGIRLKRIWGMNFGYAIAIFHLLIFPVGTAAGLIMLVGLVGASIEFETPSKVRRRKARRRAKRRHAKAKRKAQTAAV